MKITFRVVFDLPPGQPEPDADQIEHARVALLDLVRKNTLPDCGVSVLPAPLAPVVL